MSQTLEAIRARITERLDEVMGEMERVQAALAALDEHSNSGKTSLATQTTTGRSPRPKAAPARQAARAQAPQPVRSGRGQRPRVAQTRRERLLEVLTEHPDSTIAQAGAIMGLRNHTNLYGLANELRGDGLLVKDGKRWRATAPLTAVS